MIEELPNTNVSAIASRLVQMRLEGGVSALGRVLTLIIATTEPIDEAVVEAANHASAEHPMRVIVLVARPDAEETRLDAEIRVGADAGASDVVVLRAYGKVLSGVESLVNGLLLPDAPVVVWWPGTPPAVPGDDPLGSIAQRRITDAGRHGGIGLSGAIDGYTAGDTDLAWTRLTRWREHLAAILDQPPFEGVTGASVKGDAASPSMWLLAAWLECSLGISATLETVSDGERFGGVHSVRLERESGDALLERVSPSEAVLQLPDQPEHQIVLARRTLRECLAEELRILDEDAIYGQVIDHLRRNSTKTEN